uniref:Enoyl reductase (ER) domain-containing protein n=1 Tax=Ganoderma boninense TaxID=34458 RepID=A0A5K1K326_9APHY|nr:Uncharacterized protein [Ganoderma boninense]
MTAVAHTPKNTKALVLRRKGKSTAVLHDAVVEDRPLPQLQSGQLLVRIHAAAFNHRDLWIRKSLYPGIGFGRVLGSDAAGIVLASADENDPLLGKRVFCVPMRGWEKDPDAPESNFTVVGGVRGVDFGAFAQYVVVDRDQVIPTPDHLDDVHASAWPVGGVTAWRATMVNGAVKRGDNVLVTGVGGGVAIVALQLAVAAGANVYVTSGSEEKIRRAVDIGAKGGVSYKKEDWPNQLGALLKKGGKGLLNTVIDAGGGDIMGKVSPILQPGGRVVVFGMHTSPKVTMTMREVMKNQKLLGSTMGSQKDLVDATNFIAEHRIVPVVSHVLDGFESAEQGFKLLEEGSHFGKVVIRIPSDSPVTFHAKL